jgi:hypothetical protein
MNSQDVNTRLAAKTGRVEALSTSKLTDTQVIEDLYLASYTRLPSAIETKRALAGFKKAKDRRAAIEDLSWALLNSNEFLFCH